MFCKPVNCKPDIENITDFTHKAKKKQLVNEIC